MTGSALAERTELLGVQEPRLCRAPPSLTSFGQDVVDLAASTGLVLDPWQAFSLEVILGERADGMWSAFETAELVARQNGKGGIIEALELAGLFLLDERLLLHSAHEFKTSREGYLRIKGLIEGSPDLMRLVRQFRQSNEDTSVELKSGARLRFMARSRSTGRGFTAQRLIIDEAQILSFAAMGAIMPTLSAQPNPQINYFGTVPRPEDNSEHWTSIRDRGRTGDDPTLAWLEWNAGEDADLDDPEVWAAANPALGYRITEETIRRERASLADDDFGRERCSIWSSKSSIAGDIDLEQWAKLDHTEDDRPSPVAFAIAVSPDRQWSQIAVAGRRSDGLAHVQVVESKRGTGWIVERLGDLIDSWKRVGVAVNPSAPAGSLLTDLAEAGIEPALITGREYGQACGAMFDAIVEGTLRHSNQPILNISVRAAGCKPRGDSWVWRSNEPKTDVAPLEAVTLALHLLAKPREEKPTGVVRW